MMIRQDEKNCAWLTGKKVETIGSTEIQWDSEMDDTIPDEVSRKCDHFS